MNNVVETGGCGMLLSRVQMGKGCSQVIESNVEWLDYRGFLAHLFLQIR